MKKTIILILCILMLSTSVVLGDEKIASADLGNPKFLTLSLGDDGFLLDWTNPINSIELNAIEYQVDFKLGRDKWLSEKGQLLTYPLTFNSNGKSEGLFNPVERGFAKEIDLEKNSYSFRIRYKYNDVLSGFSNTVTLGLMPYYENPSAWAVEELDKAVNLNLIPDSIRDNMRKEITREEFVEVILRLYGLQTGQTVNYEGESFTDSNNPEVLKASKLGIVKGNEYGKFLPNNPITREEVAVMLTRTLKIFYPKMNFNYVENTDIAKEYISPWAYDDMQYMVYKEILKGNEFGKVNPKGHTTREEAAVLALRVYNEFN